MTPAQQELHDIIKDEITLDETLEAIRQIRSAGYEAKPLGRKDIIHAKRSEKEGWHTICVLFYDKWIDGEQVPATVREAVQGGAL